jgi:hypothetical protein
LKKILVIFALLACTLKVQAQGTFQFTATLTGANEVPPNNDPTIGTATFTLTGDILNFNVYVPALTFNTTGGTINGPAFGGTNAPILFDLGGFRFHSGSTFGDPPVYQSSSPPVGPAGAGPFTLTPSQIGDLENGLWYVNVTSGQQTNGQLRGQIVLDGPTLGYPVVTNNVLQFTVDQVTGFSYIIQASSELGTTNWVSLATNTAPFTFTDTDFTNSPQRFYRAFYRR